MEKSKKFKVTSKLGYIILTVVTAAMGVALLAFGTESLDALAITIGAITALCGIGIGVFALADKTRGFIITTARYKFDISDSASLGVA